MLIDAMIENPVHMGELLAIKEVDAIFVPEERMDASELEAASDAVRAAGKKCIVQLPYVFRNDICREYARREEKLLACADGWLVRSIDEAGFLEERGWLGLRIFDAGMYGWNLRARQMMRRMGADVVTAPFELTIKEIADTFADDDCPYELVIYGRQPAMVSAQCIQKNEEGCSKGVREYCFRPMKDRTGAVFIAQNRCRTCTNVIYNSVPLWLLDQDLSAVRPDRVCFRFTDETKGLPSGIIRGWLDKSAVRPERFTRGHKTL
jgi:putative protease